MLFDSGLLVHVQVPLAETWIFSVVILALFFTQWKDGSGFFPFISISYSLLFSVASFQGSWTMWRRNWTQRLHRWPHPHHRLTTLCFLILTTPCPTPLPLLDFVFLSIGSFHFASSENYFCSDSYVHTWVCNDTIWCFMFVNKHEEITTWSFMIFVHFWCRNAEVLTIDPGMIAYNTLHHTWCRWGS